MKISPDNPRILYKTNPHFCPWISAFLSWSPGTRHITWENINPWWAGKMLWMLPSCRFIGKMNHDNPKIQINAMHTNFLTVPSVSILRKESDESTMRIGVIHLPDKYPDDIQIMLHPRSNLTYFSLSIHRQHPMLPKPRLSTLETKRRSSPSHPIWLTFIWPTCIREENACHPWKKQRLVPFLLIGVNIRLLLYPEIGDT